MAMEYLEGASLDELCDEVAAGRLADDWTIPLAVSLVYQFCEGLHHVHELTAADGEALGIVHRDISPSNLFVTRDGVGKVLDFGIAKIRAAASGTASTLKGKFAYMSPEQLCSEPLDRRSDVFSLAVVLFEALTGRMMFDQKSEALVALAIMDGEFLLPGAIRNGRPARARSRDGARPGQVAGTALRVRARVRRGDHRQRGWGGDPDGTDSRRRWPRPSRPIWSDGARSSRRGPSLALPRADSPAGERPGAPPIEGEPMAPLAHVEQLRRPDRAALPQRRPRPRQSRFVLGGAGCPRRRV